MSKEEYPITTAVRCSESISYILLRICICIKNQGGSTTASKELNIEEHSINKTLVMETDPRHQILVLMYGDKEVSKKQLARILEAKRVLPASEQIAQ